jgi:predicted phage terminase large subunit-like protein
MKYFPNLIHAEEGKRALWNNDAMIVDHPARGEQGVVDSTVMTCGLTKTIVGKHCDLLINDDMQVHNNNTTKGRDDVKKWFSAAASVMSANAECLTVGTRYHPNDLYDLLLGMEVEPEYDSEGNPLSEPTPMFKVHMANVEEEGEFLWPRTQDEKGTWYGFNWKVLNQKKALYDHNIVDFYAQYYNNPNDSSISPIGRDLFQYYDKQDLRFFSGLWSIGSAPLSVYAAIDPAFTTNDRSDYTAICIGGIDSKGNRYLMHIERYKTDSPSVTYDRIIELYKQYAFKELRIEAVAAQRALGVAMGEYIKSRGVRIPIDLFNPPHVDGGKDMRILNGLEPQYKSQAMYHYKGGNVQLLEEELTSLSPRNDDMKDAWFMVNDMMKMPIARRNRSSLNNVISYHPKFGGVTGVTHG